MLKKNAKAKDEEAEYEASKESQEGENDVGVSDPTQKEKLLALYQTLKDLGINSIGDLEVKISRL